MRSLALNPCRRARYRMGGALVSNLLSKYASVSRC